VNGRQEREERWMMTIERSTDGEIRKKSGGEGNCATIEAPYEGSTPRSKLRVRIRNQWVKPPANGRDAGEGRKEEQRKRDQGKRDKRRDRGTRVKAKEKSWSGIGEKE